MPSQGTSVLNCPLGSSKDAHKSQSTLLIRASGGCGRHSWDGAELGDVQPLSLGVCFKPGLQKGQNPSWPPCRSPCAVGISHGRSMASGRGLGQPELNAGHAWMEICSAVTSLC